MEPILELKVGDLVLRIDRQICVGFGDCIEMAADAFELDEDGVARFRHSIVAVDRELLLRACDICPVDAISVHDAAGNQLVP